MAIRIKDHADFYTQLIQAGSKLVIVEFFATWSDPCKMISPKLEKLAREMAGSIVVLKVDDDEFSELFIEYKIQSLPTYIFFESEMEIKRMDDFRGDDYKKLKAMIDEFI